MPCLAGRRSLFVALFPQFPSAMGVLTKTLFNATRSSLDWRATLDLRPGTSSATVTAWGNPKATHRKCGG